MSPVVYMGRIADSAGHAAAFLEQASCRRNILRHDRESSHQYTHPDDYAVVMSRPAVVAGAPNEVRLFDQADSTRRSSR